MLKKIIIAVIVLALAAVIFLDFKFLKRYYKIYFGLDNMFVSADVDDFDRGPVIGSTFPSIKALYKGAEVNSLQDFAGSKGTVFVVNRSLEWCPYCMRQAIELQALYGDFQSANINLVMMTYDAPELQNAFINRHDLQYTVLSDIEATSFTNLGVLREDYGPDHRNYGLPYPGMIVIDSDGVIRGKLFIEAYSTRVDTKSVLALTQQWLGIK